MNLLRQFLQSLGPGRVLRINVHSESATIIFLRSLIAYYIKPRIWYEMMSCLLEYRQCSLLRVDRRYGRICLLHLQLLRWLQATGSCSHQCLETLLPTDVVDDFPLVTISIDAVAIKLDGPGTWKVFTGANNHQVVMRKARSGECPGSKRNSEVLTGFVWIGPSCPLLLGHTWYSNNRLHFSYLLLTFRVRLHLILQQPF
jgi:hypothetical protein